jgi:hypothetical protein
MERSDVCTLPFLRWKAQLQLLPVQAFILVMPESVGGCFGRMCWGLRGEVRRLIQGSKMASRQTEDVWRITVNPSALGRLSPTPCL